MTEDVIAKTVENLFKKKIINNHCPRNPHELIERLQSEEFRSSKQTK